MTISQAAKIWGVSPQRIYQWITAGQIRAQIIDGHYRIDDDAEPPAHQAPGRKAGAK